MSNRKTNIECLRIIAMAMIILSHIATHGIFDTTDSGKYHAILQLFTFGGAIGDNIFILISGYFLILSKFSVKKVFKLFFQVTFYSVFLTIVSFIIGQTPFSLKKLFQSAVPFLSGGGYWFIVTYIIIYIFSPILNFGIKHISNHFLIFHLLFFGFLYIVVPNIIHQLVSVNNYGYNKLTWLIYMYVVGAMLRLYPVSDKTRKWSNLLLPFFILVMLVLKYILEISMIPQSNFVGKILYVFVKMFTRGDLNGTLVVAVSIMLFILFSNLNLRRNRVANLFASTVFGTYLIHDHPLFMRYLWDQIFRLSTLQNEDIFLPYCAVVVVIVFFGCGFIDLIRQFILEKPIFESDSINALCKRMDCWLNMRNELYEKIE